MKKVLIAPDSFKGSLSAERFCSVSADTLKKIDPEMRIDQIPMADGGEGTVKALVYYTKGQLISCDVMGPLWQKKRAVYGILGDQVTAVIEMAEASGLPLLLEADRNPMLTSTYGVGQLIKDALERGCQKLLIGIGGSATNDGGMGMLSALGYKFLDVEGRLLKGTGGDLALVDCIDMKDVDIRLKDIEILVACDVDNPLIGSRGAAYVYGPQKGGTSEMIKELDAGMAHFSQKIKTYTGQDVSHVPGAGAAGGLGAGLMAFLGAKLESGFEMVSKTIELEKCIKEGDYDLIITGEGQMNHQTLHGKLPYGVARLGEKYNVPVVGIVGALGQGYEPILEAGMVAVFSIMNRPMTLETAFSESEDLLRDTILNVAKLFFYDR